MISYDVTRAIRFLKANVKSSKSVQMRALERVKMKISRDESLLS
jgi:hypothetical protein